MNLQQLYYFKKIAETEQFTQAALELHVTQATLSSAVTNLEKELGVSLFERHGRYLMLTECGKTFYSGVQEAVFALERAEKSVREIANPAGNTVRFGYLQSINDLALNLVSEWSRARENPPKFQLTHSNAAELERALSYGEMDLAIMTCPKGSGIATRLIGYQRSVLVLPKDHPFCGRKSVSMAELNGMKFIAYTPDCNIREYYDEVLDKAGAYVNIAAESRIHESIVDMVGYGMGVALMPHMKSLDARKDVVSVEIEDKMSPRALYLAWPEAEPFGDMVADFRSYVLRNASMDDYL